VLAEALTGSATDAYVFRPCIVAGPEAPALLDLLPYLRLEHMVPSVVLRVVGRVPVAKLVLPDHGVPFQLVHHDDVAAALVAGVLGAGDPGVYNLAGAGEVRWSDVAKELNWYTVRIPKQAIDVTANIVGRIPLFTVEAGWLEALRVPMLMDCTRARQQLGGSRHTTAVKRSTNWSRRAGSARSLARARPGHPTPAGLGISALPAPHPPTSRGSSVPLGADRIRVINTIPEQTLHARSAAFIWDAWSEYPLQQRAANAVRGSDRRCHDGAQDLEAARPPGDLRRGGRRPSAARNPRGCGALRALTGRDRAAGVPPHDRRTRPARARWVGAGLKLHPQLTDGVLLAEGGTRPAGSIRVVSLGVDSLPRSQP
jgi:hypothetical protein